jgi:lipopolysaccharide transport system permease protein
MSTSAFTNASVPEPHWIAEITPNRGLFDLHLGDLWRYRDLVLLFVRRDFVSVYKQTILGPAWHIIQPLLTTVVFTIVFGNIANLPTDGLPKFLFYMAGNVLWAYFAGCINSTSNTFLSNAGIFGKVYFPRLVMPLSVVISQLISFSIQFVFFLGFIAYFMLQGAPVRPNAWALAVPVLLVMMAGLGLGLGIIVSALTTRYRDLKQLVGFGVHLLMYATPVIYPLSAVPAKYQALIRLNPMTPIMETFRAAFLGGGVVRPMALVSSALVVVVILTIGLLLFNRVERTFMDTV